MKAKWILSIVASIAAILIYIVQYSDPARVDAPPNVALTLPVPTQQSGSTSLISILPGERQGAAAVRPVGERTSLSVSTVVKIPYSELIESAEKGDAHSAYLVSQKIRWCYELPRRLQAVADAGGDVKDASWLEPQFNKLMQEKESCADVPNSAIGDRFKWIEMAAEKGEINALLDYYMYGSPVVENPELGLKNPALLDEYKTKSLRYLHRAAAACSHEAFVSLSGIYQDGIMAPADAVAAYMYALAASGQHSSSSYQRMADALGKGIDAEQRTIALQRAREIVGRFCEGR